MRKLINNKIKLYLFYKKCSLNYVCRWLVCNLLLL